MGQPARPDHPRFGAFISEHAFEKRVVMRFERGVVVEGLAGEDPTEWPLDPRLPFDESAAALFSALHPHHISKRAV